MSIIFRPIISISSISARGNCNKNVTLASQSCNKLAILLLPKYKSKLIHDEKNLFELNCTICYEQFAFGTNYW
jgi:hypothetical protein